MSTKEGEEVGITDGHALGADVGRADERDGHRPGEELSTERSRVALVPLEEGSQCPGCREPLEVWEEEREESVPGLHGPQTRRIRLKVMGCDNDACPFLVSVPVREGRAPWLLVGHAPGLPSSCAWGHLASWAARVEFGQVVAVCMALGPDRGDSEPCGQQFRPQRPPTGFLARGGAPRDATKARVVATLGYGNRLCLADIVHVTGLTRGRVAGCLRRLQQGGYVVATGPVLLATHTARVYGLSARGRLWGRWALAIGLMEGPEEAFVAEPLPRRGRRRSS